MIAKFMQWVRTKQDRMDEASDCKAAIIDTGKLSAVAVARNLDRLGNRSDFAKNFIIEDPESRLATGHGVTVEYDNGNLRTVRYQDD